MLYLRAERIKKEDKLFERIGLSVLNRHSKVVQELARSIGGRLGEASAKLVPRKTGARKTPVLEEQMVEAAQG